MGICLDTEQKNENQEPRSGDRSWAEGRPSLIPGGADLSEAQRNIQTPPDGKFPMQNNSHVKFETPKVPVVFVLGGPGSGKVTHCDNLMQEKKGVVHINMTDLLQQYAIGNDMQDFGTLSSKTVTEVLMLEMKMAPAAKTYLVSGYPRSMRDVAEYSDKIQVVNGVILVSWRQKVLERQIEYGARLGHVVLSLARMELNNFYKNVMPVADYFDQSNMLVAVNGERNPGEVYKDFRAAVLKVLGSQEDPSAVANGVTGAGPGGIPGEIVSVEPATPYPIVQSPPSLPLALPMSIPAVNHNIPRVDSKQHVIQADVITVRAADMEPGYQSPVKPGAIPPVLWVIGGPGSNKAALCMRAAQQLKGWVHFSVGRSLRTLAETADLRSGTDAAIARQSITGGEMVPQGIVMKLIQEKLHENSKAAGIIIDGFPRDIDQAKLFEQTYQQKPRVILLDCSKLQLGRGRLDDSVAAFRRRLELFRELSLPMLKSLDTEQRLIIVDGDTDTEPVQDDFNKVMLQFMQSSSVATGNGVHEPSNGTATGGHGNHNMPFPNMGNATGVGRQTIQGIKTISEQVQNSAATIAPTMTNGVNHMANGAIKNGTAMANGYANGFAAGVGNGIQGMTNGISGMANGIPGMASSKVAPLQKQINNTRNAFPTAFSSMDSHI